LNERYFLGIDSGGTKAAYALARHDGEIVSLHLGKGYARNIETTATTVAEIKKSIKKILTESGVDLAQVEGICFALPFFGELAEKDQEITEALQNKYTGTTVYVTNDCEVAWAGSLAGQPGINVVAGTGAIAYGRNESGEMARAGGWAPFFSDEGACYWLGRKTMQLFSKQADGRIARGPLYDIVRAHYDLDDDFEFIVLMERDVLPARDKVAGLQMLLEKAAIQKDPTAIALYRAGIDELVSAIKTVADKLGFTGTPFLVSYSGGLFKASDFKGAVKAKRRYVNKPFKQCVKKLGAVLQEPMLDPYHGAVLVAIREGAPELLDHAIETLTRGNLAVEPEET